MKKKTNIFLIGVVFLGVVLILLYQFQLKSSEKNINEENQKIEVISAEKPESFNGVEMTTYKSSYGYEITYPKNWLFRNITEHYARPSLEAVNIKAKEIDDRYFSDDTFIIDVEKDSLEGFVGKIRSGEIITIKKDVEIKPILFNNLSGLKIDLRSPSAYYFFERNEKLFLITFLYDPLMGISEQEALWVLSTFKITE